MSTARPRAALAALLMIMLSAAGCSGDTPDSPHVAVAAGDATADVAPTLYCVDGKAQLGGDDQKTPAIEVEPDQKVTVTVPSEVAEKSWVIQIWSVDDSSGSAVPAQQIGNIQVGTETSFDGFSTSDAVPDRYFVIVAIPEDPKCDAKGSAGIWTLLVSRVAA